jgi:hypothetical protein
MAHADDGFYVIPTMKGNYAPVPKTGQTLPYGPKDDGTLKKGVASPAPRFTDNGNGTVTDQLTGLIWMKDAGVLGYATWEQAIIIANGLADGSGGLTDGSQAGDWRLANRKELESLVDCGRYSPAVPVDNPFTNVISWGYWSSSTYTNTTTTAWVVNFADGYVANADKTYIYYVWCVRGGK